MSAFHYIDENNKPCGPVDEANLRKIAEAARAAGRELMIAKPGDPQWLSFDKAFAAGTPAAAPNRPQQLARPQPAVRPAAQPAAKPAAAPAPAPEPAQHVETPKAQPAAQHRPEPAVAPEQYYQTYDTYSPKPKVRAPWLSYVCYAVSALFLLFSVAVIFYIFSGSMIAPQIVPEGANDPALFPPPGDANEMPFAFRVILGFTPISLLSALFFAWAGKSLSLLNQIAHNTR